MTLVKACMLILRMVVLFVLMQKKGVFPVKLTQQMCYVRAAIRRRGIPYQDLSAVPLKQENSRVKGENVCYVPPSQTALSAPINLDLFLAQLVNKIISLMEMEAVYNVPLVVQLAHKVRATWSVLHVPKDMNFQDLLAVM